MLWITSWITDHTTHWGLHIDKFWWTAIWARHPAVPRRLVLSVPFRNAERRWAERNPVECPELPEVEALADYLRTHAVGRTFSACRRRIAVGAEDLRPTGILLHGRTRSPPPIGGESTLRLTGR